MKLRTHAVNMTLLCAAGAAAALAVDVPDPVWTYCELETFTSGSNDTFSKIEMVTPPSQFADCFYLTGKLQKDCVWDREVKCCLVAYSKPFVATDPNGVQIQGIEQIVTTDNNFTDGITEILTPVLADGTIRLGVASVFDCFDFTLNGLFGNGLQGETGHVIVHIDWRDSAGASVGTDTYSFDFQEGREALRLAYIAPQGATQAHVGCDGSSGVTGVCYDVDYYWVKGLTPREVYCVTGVGGLDEFCRKTDSALGWFDKNGNPTGGPLGVNHDGPNGNVYPELCVLADDTGAVRFAVTGESKLRGKFDSFDDDFDGLLDGAGQLYFNELDVIRQDLTSHGNVAPCVLTFTPGASTKDTPSEVVRIPRIPTNYFDQLAATNGFNFPPGHGVCGCYTFKVRINLHNTPPNGGGTPGNGLAQRADMNSDGVIDAFDLSTLLSFWGPVQ